MSGNIAQGFFLVFNNLSNPELYHRRLYSNITLWNCQGGARVRDVADEDRYIDNNKVRGRTDG